ncbi:hypothetical protein ABW20_dc0105170 [Dactylellina cionopaga]|nr:hypothetical protein ABW20_dc0105170 [Dactylellina cionopaga]
MATQIADYLLNLRSVVRSNLEYQHYWTDIKLLDTLADLGENAQVHDPLPRPMIYGRPPDQLYNPEPAASTDASLPKPPPEMEYVLPVHLDEKFALSKWAAVFDALPSPPEGNDRKKRITVAVLSGDSTVVYYVMHDGIVKPRQN